MIEPAYIALFNACISIARWIFGILKKIFRTVKSSLVWIFVFINFLITLLLIFYFFSTDHFILSNDVTEINEKLESIDSRLNKQPDMLKILPNLIIDVEDGETRKFIEQQIDRLVDAVDRRNYPQN